MIIFFIVLYVAGFITTFFAEFRLGEVIVLVILKAIFWPIWAIIMFFNRTGNNT